MIEYQEELEIKDVVEEVIESEVSKTENATEKTKKPLEKVES